MSTEEIAIAHEHYFAQCDALADIIQSHEDELITLLCQYETYESAKDEVMRTLEALHGMRDEVGAVKEPLTGLTVSTFFPLNLPLYSLIIFGIAPSVFAKQVFIRPPEIMHGILTSLWDVLHISGLFPDISLQATPRHIFVQLYAQESDVIIFTGRYENALAIHEQCPYALLIYNGSGVNPLLLFDNADVDLAARKAVEMRCFNSGQDCAGPDAFFVPSQLADEFVDKLKTILQTIKVGDSSDPSVRVGRTMKQAYITELKQWLENEKEFMVFGGEIEERSHLVHPAIIRKKLSQLTENYAFHEFFAPYFYVIEYDNDAELEKVLLSKPFMDRGMYISVFGDNPKLEAKLTFVQLLKNVIVNDVEQGNQQYGGFGIHANFLLYGDKTVVHPILISRDIHEMLSS
ncbi:hypothetical protein BH09PAT3_BH09PAT3_2420 [soil metagenome]